jgi:AcrR family transcriptional regulator
MTTTGPGAKGPTAKGPSKPRAKPGDPQAKPGDPQAKSASVRGAKGEQTRRAILDAAIVRFGQDGYRATSVTDIAREAGVGPTLTYAYFPNKEALFLAALDEDAAGVIEDGTGLGAAGDGPTELSASFMASLVAAVDRHPLARRVLAGLEPHATDRLLDIPALAELRKAVAERLRADQATGAVRSDIDPVAIANGTVLITLSLLMSSLQFGSENSADYEHDVLAVFDAAITRRPRS